MLDHLIDPDDDPTEHDVLCDLPKEVAWAFLEQDEYGLQQFLEILEENQNAGR